MKTMTSLKDKLTDAATSLGDSASGVVQEVESRAKDAWDTVQYRTNRAVRKSTACAHKHPGRTALTAFGLGVGLGLLLHRQAPASLPARSMARPSPGVPVGLIIACIALIRSIFFSGPGRVEARSPLREENTRVAPGAAAPPEEAWESRETYSD